MENLLKRLKEEAGLTPEQSAKVLRIILDYMEKEDLDIDWNKFLSGKYEKFKEQSESFIEDAKRKIRDITDKLD